jgi:hypothetical protein
MSGGCEEGRASVERLLWMMLPVEIRCHARISRSRLQVRGATTLYCRNIGAPGFAVLHLGYGGPGCGAP